MMNRIAFIFLLLFARSVNTQNIDLDHHFNLPVFDHASVGLAIVDLEDGSPVYEHNSDLGLIPASTLKVITTFSALEILGPEFRFETHTYLHGEKLPDGSFYGNIVIKGSGDPTLGSPIFDKAQKVQDLVQQIVSALKSQRISCIEGSIIIDNSLYEDSPFNPTWQWNDLSNYYAAGVWPFNIHENLFYIYFERENKENSATAISHISPSILDVTLDSEVTTGKQNSGDNAYVYSDPLSNELRITGTIPPGDGLFNIKAALPQPSQFFKSQLTEALLKNDIAITNTSKDVKLESNYNVLSTFKSPSLSEIVRQANLESNNMYCEALLKYIGTNSQINGSTVKGSTLKGIETVKEKLRSDSLDFDSFTYRDGSGLSNRNRITPSLLASFIFKSGHKHDIGYLERHLSYAHPDGDVTYMFKDSRDKYDVYLKSGSMSQVMAYCGIVKFKEKSYCFSFISNGHLKGNRSIRLAFEQIIADFSTD